MLRQWQQDNVAFSDGNTQVSLINRAINHFYHQTNTMEVILQAMLQPVKHLSLDNWHFLAWFCAKQFLRKKDCISNTNYIYRTNDIQPSQMDYDKEMCSIVKIHEFTS